MNLESILKKYDYKLPNNLIAQEPTNPRDNARILVYRRANKDVSYSIVKNLGEYLPKNAVLIFNQTKVIPARLTIFKSSGGKAELLYLGYDKQTKLIKALINKPIPINSLVYFFRNNKKPIPIQIKNKIEGIYYLKFKGKPNQFLSILKKYGKTPLPPYLKKSILNETDRQKEYQTIFAKKGESIAAPTASLHFTHRLISNLKKTGIDIRFINLEVGLGTFFPISEKNILLQELHIEKYTIPKTTATFIKKAKKQNRTIIAVGTTVVRALESWALNKKISGNTKIFIKPPYKFKIINGLITNFHVPKSSLLMLVSALIGRKTILKLYNKAIKQKFRFFSFGDCMLIL